MFQKDLLDQILKQQVEAHYAEGVNALVYHKDQEVYYGQYGYRNCAAKEPMDRDTVVRLYSMTKPITATAGMILVERGLLKMEDPLEKYLPEFKQENLKVVDPTGGFCPAKRSITIWDLFHMTSGIPYPDIANESTRQMGVLIYRLIQARLNGERVTTRDYAREIAKVPLSHQPHEEWLYGFSADVLGAVIEVVSGMNYEDFLRKEIFEPLGMKETGFSVPEALKSRFATAYRQTKNNVPRIYKKSFLGEYYGEDVAFLSGGAGLTSTIDDYMKFARMLASGGRLGDVQILKPETVRYMSDNHLNEAQMRTYNWDALKGYGYGCLMRTLIDPEIANTKSGVGEFGWDGWMGCYLMIDPEHEIVLVYTMQCTNADSSVRGMVFRNGIFES